MKRRDDSRPSLVEFLGSIKFSRAQCVSHPADESNGQFARMQPKAGATHRGEEYQLIRSAN